MRVIEVERCPACGGNDFQSFDVGGGNVLRRCAACDLVSAPRYADPRDVYVDGYMFGEAGPFGLDVRGADFQHYLSRVAHRRVRMIERATHLRRGSLLDVGAGTGDVLAAARERGWSVRGVEPERTGAQMALDRGLDVEVKTLEESGLPERSFDVVSAFHVLEHIPDSRRFLRMLARWARPGGFVVIEVPNFESLARRRRGGGWSGLRPLEHIVHFSPATLPRALRAAGIEPVSLRAPVYLGPPQSLDQALGDLAQARVRWIAGPLSPRRDGTRYPSGPAWALLRAVAEVHDRLGLGQVVFCVGRVR